MSSGALGSRKGKRHDLSDPMEALRAAVLRYLSLTPPIKSIFDDLSMRVVAGDDVESDVGRLARFEWFFAIATLISSLDDDFEETMRELDLTDDQLVEIRALRGRNREILEAPIDAATDANLYGIRDTWTNLDADYQFSPKRGRLFLDAELRNGTRVVYSSRDKIEDFIGLARAITSRCQDALEWAVSSGVTLDGEHVSRIRERTRDLLSVAKSADDLVTELSEPDKVELASESVEEAKET